MADTWTPSDTNTHQDHVIAHVIGATVLAYIVLDEVLYVLLDIGFVWNIFLDGEMGLLPHPVAVNELEVDNQTREQIKKEIDGILSGRTQDLVQLAQPAVACLLTEVNLFASDDRRLLVLAGEPGSLEIETSLESGTIELREWKSDIKNQRPEPVSDL